MACESSVIYRRRNLGKVSVAAMAELLLFDAENPRSLVYQLERLRTNLRATARCVGIVAPERLVDEISTRLRRLDPADLEDVDDDGAARRVARSARRRRSPGCANCPTSSPRPSCRCPAACSRCGAPMSGGRCRDGVPGRTRSVGPPASTSGAHTPLLPGDPPHRVQLLRRGDQFLRPRLPDTARLRRGNAA